MKNSLIYPDRRSREQRIAYFGRWPLLRRIRMTMIRRKYAASASVKG